MCCSLFKSVNSFFLITASILLLSLFSVFPVFAQSTISSCSSNLSASNIRIIPIDYTPNPAFKFRVFVTLTNTGSSIVKAQIFTYSGSSLTDNSGIALLAPKQSTELSALYKNCTASLKLKVTSSTTIVSAGGTSTSTSTCTSSVPVKSQYCCNSCATPTPTPTRTPLCTPTPARTRPARSPRPPLTTDIMGVISRSAMDQCIKAEAPVENLALEQRLILQAKSLLRKFNQQDLLNKKDKCGIDTTTSKEKVNSSYETIKEAGKYIFSEGIEICGNNCVTVSYADQVLQLMPEFNVIESETASLNEQVQACYKNRNIKTKQKLSGVKTTIKVVESKLRKLIEDSQDIKVCP